MESPPTVTVDSQTRKKIQCKQELIIASLQRFYTARDDLNEVVELLKGTSEISLRLVDWFVTNYAKVHSTAYTANGQEFVVYMNYKNQLKAYSKKLFDPFCRRERISFQVPGHEPFLTTVGKLNFFRWAIEKDILTYIKGHQTEIEREMNVSMRELAKKTTKSESGTRKRNTTRDIAPGTNIQKHTCEIEMRFD
jgi:hypothetical protein|uniref:Uncharacterized protein n=1 Tax=viral metagenome TaxID=1070528 RepID=A0A6C0L6A6_9ZZZZ